MEPELANLNLDPPRQSSLWRRGLLPALLVNAVFFAGVALSLQWPGADAGRDVATRADTGNETRSMGAAPAMAPAPPNEPAAQAGEPPPQPQSRPQLQPTPQLKQQPQRTSEALPAASPSVGTATPVSSRTRPESTSRAEPRPRHQAADSGASAMRQATGVAVQPSFDCARARSRAERLICSDPELAQLDRDTGRLHARAKAAARDPAALRRQDDRAWKQREAECRDKACLLAWYAHRREQLRETVAQSR